MWQPLNPSFSFLSLARDSPNIASLCHARLARPRATQPHATALLGWLHVAAPHECTARLTCGSPRSAPPLAAAAMRGRCRRAWPTVVLGRHQPAWHRWGNAWTVAAGAGHDPPPPLRVASPPWLAPGLLAGRIYRKTAVIPRNRHDSAIAPPRSHAGRSSTLPRSTDAKWVRFGFFDLEGQCQPASRKNIPFLG